jgi:hypothetical protein
MATSRCWGGWLRGHGCEGLAEHEACGRLEPLFHKGSPGGGGRFGRRFAWCRCGPARGRVNCRSTWQRLGYTSASSRREGGSAGTLLLMMVMVACVRAWWDRGRCIWRHWARRTSGRHCRSRRREGRLDRRCDHRCGGSRLGRDPFSAGWARHSDGGGSGGGKLGVCFGDFTA